MLGRDIVTCAADVPPGVLPADQDEADAAAALWSERDQHLLG